MNRGQAQIYKSNWIPRPIIFKILSTPILSLETTVSTLNDEEHKWKENLIHQHFISKDADQTIKSPLLKTLRTDNPLWSFDKHGNHSNKSIQQVVVRLNMLDCPSPSKLNITEWNAIWKLELPKKK